MSGRSQTVESVQEGCRWLHKPPTGADFAKWFKENVKLHEGLEHEDYVNGITLIPNKEKCEETRLDSRNDPEIVELKRLVFSPYPQVETRDRYFWDWCRENDYLGEIAILSALQPSPHLPAGVTITRISTGQSTVAEFVSVKAQVRVFERSIRTGDKGRAVMIPPPATKTVPLRNRYGPDENAMMKAETGAIGRALGFAGMLVIPGAGISTAEDMQELTTAEPAAEVPATLPAAAGTVEPLERPTEDQEKVLRDLVDELLTELAAYPEDLAQFEAWAEQRAISLEPPIPPAALRPIERQLRRKVDQAKRKS